MYVTTEGNASPHPAVRATAAVECVDSNAAAQVDGKHGGLWVFKYLVYSNGVATPMVSLCHH